MDEQHEAARWIAHAKVETYDGPVSDGKLIDTYEAEGNLLMYGGASALWDLLSAGGAVTAFNAANTYIGVGDSSVAAVATQTDLQAASNKHREIVDAAPTFTDGTTSANAVISDVATFETGDANFAWNEWGLFNAASSGRMLNRKVFSAGTKVNTNSRVFTVTFTIA